MFNHYKTFKIILVSCFVCTCLAVSNLYALDTERREKIVCDRAGYIYKINPDSFVINDMTYSVNANSRLLDESGNPVNIKSFKAGDFVGYKLDAEFEILELRKMTPQDDQRPKILESDTPQSSGRKIYNKDGVWKNN